MTGFILPSLYSAMFKRNLFDINAYCNKVQCLQTQTQKDVKQMNTTTNTTQISTKMRYAQYIRQRTAA